MEILAKHYSEKKWSAFAECSHAEIEWLDTDPKPTQVVLDALEEDWALMKIKKEKCVEIRVLRDKKISEDSLRNAQAISGEAGIAALTTIEQVNNYNINTEFS